MLKHTDPVEILLVEDSPTDAKLTIRALQKSNIMNPVKHLEDGAAALDYIFGTGEFADRSVDMLPRVVLLDLKLPKVSGMEVLRRIRSDPRTETLPIVILTSSQEQRDLIEGYKLHVNSYIVKPVDFGQFSETVKALGLYWLVVNTPPPATAEVAETVQAQPVSR